MTNFLKSSLARKITAFVLSLGVLTGVAFALPPDLNRSPAIDWETRQIGFFNIIREEPVPKPFRVEIVNSNSEDTVKNIDEYGNPTIFLGLIKFMVSAERYVWNDQKDHDFQDAQLFTGNLTSTGKVCDSTGCIGDSTPSGTICGKCRGGISFVDCNGGSSCFASSCPKGWSFAEIKGETLGRSPVIKLPSESYCAKD